MCNKCFNIIFVVKYLTTVFFKKNQTKKLSRCVMNWMNNEFSRDGRVVSPKRKTTRIRRKKNNKKMQH